LVLTVACIKAKFEPITGGEGGTGGTTEAGTTGNDDSGLASDVGGSCPEPNLPCSGSPSTGICDPVCQTGDCDWCSQKCTYVFDGTSAQPTCASSTGHGAFPNSCTRYSAATSKQSDDCAPGSICLRPTVGDSVSYCFQLCAAAADCLGGLECGQRQLSSLGGSVGVCDPPYSPCGTDGTCCDPLALTGCPDNRVCLLVSPDPGAQPQHSRTVCEFGNGGQVDSQPCSASRDCMEKYTCVNNMCRRVCNTASPCPPGATCKPWGVEYGYCSN
jgi:hypothetical protein